MNQVKRKFIPLVSVIIPAYNEEKNIGRCIASIAGQTYFLKHQKRIEVVVVNDCSVDQTAAVVKNAGTRVGLKVRVINLKNHQERGVTRNIGAKAAGGYCLLFLDADMEMDKRVVEDCLNAINNKKENCKGVIIPEESVGEGFWSKCRVLEKRCYVGNDTIEAVRFFDADAFWDVGGWDQAMISGEDWDLTRRLREKYKVGRIKSLIFHHEGKLTLVYTAKKKYYYGTYSLIYWKKNLSNTQDVISLVIRSAFLRNWKLLMLDPFHAVGMLFLKGVEFSAGILGLARALFLDKEKFFKDVI